MGSWNCKQSVKKKFHCLQRGYNIEDTDRKTPFTILINHFHWQLLVDDYVLTTRVSYKIIYRNELNGESLFPYTIFDNSYVNNGDRTTTQVKTMDNDGVNQEYCTYSESGCATFQLPRKMITKEFCK